MCATSSVISETDLRRHIVEKIWCGVTGSGVGPGEVREALRLELAKTGRARLAGAGDGM